MTKKILRRLLPQMLINYLWHLPKAILAAHIYGNPSKDLQLITVTGTDGKTTTTTMIYHILKTARKKAAIITTVEARVGRKKIETGLHVTSPDPFKLQSLLRRMKSKKIRYVCLEVTSHGLDQFRLFPVKSKVSVLTNITHEHLDYHRNFKDYTNAKLKLFKRAEHSVINKDADIFPEVKHKLSKIALATYSIDQPSQLKAEKVTLLKNRTKFTVGNIEYTLPLTGKYNVYNALAAISTALFLEVSPSDIKRALASFNGIKGRMEKISGGKGRNIIIDFAHTPNALKEALTNLRNMRSKDQKIIAVFGTAGLRDKNKRPMMGKIASELADEIVITAEDPRTEKVSKIIKQIKSGIPKGKHAKVHEVGDRQSAITYAITKLAKPGDWVGIFGKGHEQSMCYGTKEMPWSEHKAVEKALKEI